MNVSPLVSICIPVYNGADFISNCLQCCISQSYKNIEIIVCDDCSTDNTAAVIKEFSSQDSRIKYFKNEQNLGLVKNWNTTVNYANGAYIKWLFQDDTMELNAIEQFVEAAKKGYKFIISKRNFVLKGNFTPEQINYYNKGVRKLEDFFSASDKEHYFTADEITGYACENIALNFIGEPSLTFINKESIIKTGLYDEKLHQICDLEYHLRLAIREGVFVINKPLCGFSIHSQSTTNANINKKYFRLRYFEQAFYAYKLLCHEHFLPLQLKINRLNRFKLKFYIKYRLYEATKLYQKNKNPEYHELLSEFPELKKYTNASVFSNVIFRLIDLAKGRT